MNTGRFILHDGGRIPYTVVRSDRRRTAAVIVARDGSVCVRVPRRVTEAQITRLVDSRSEWIVRKRAEFASRPTEPEAAPLDAGQMADARHFLAGRLEACWAVFARSGERIPPLRVRAMRTRWGSLSPDGRMCLNAHLMRASAACVDYVVFHELCHLRERGHGADFYREVAGYVPEWKARRRELRDVMP